MRKFIRVIRNLIIFAAVCYIGFLAYNSIKDTKSFSVDFLNIEATVQEDGNMQVRETRTLTFKNGPFTRAFIDIPKKGSNELRNISISEGDKIYEYTEDITNRPDGFFNVSETYDKYHIEWYYNVVEGTKVFNVDYLVVDAVKVYNDTAELYWNFVGDENAVDAKEVEVIVHLPQGANKDAIKVFGHGPLQGQVSIINETEAMWKTTNLPKNRFLETRILFPIEIVPNSQNKEDKNAYDEIMEEEKVWADEADAERAKHKMLGLVNLVLVVVTLVIIIVLYMKNGKKLKPKVKYDYYRELPGKYSPAEMVVLMTFGKVTSPALSATIMDLARKGFISMEIQGQGKKSDVIFHKLKNINGTLIQHEKYIFNFLFSTVSKNKETVSINEIKVFSKKNKSKANYFWVTWSEKVKNTEKVKSFKDEKSFKTRFLLRFIGVIYIVAWVVVVIKFEMTEFKFGVPIGASMLWIFSTPFPRRTAYGEEELMMWKAFKTFLKDFSNLDKAELPQLILWEHYLVYATALGVAKQVLKQLPYAYPEINNSQTTNPTGWYGMYNNTSYNDNNLANIESVASITTAIATLGESIHSISNSYKASSSSSSDGGGGGFSGGGGGGGGGSSFGAD
ncbi:DUF2207 domain-containing protein [Clostridium grantii]|uniref:Uncharacterized membrane protein n=1 Tax=Clostridium grantii DSM 8605 TaxID=1121316 RepID=A0A1M5QHT7_9CLOT|nr:DUF2207 domain-containing protein [Clostridium grantii]SHH13043.1 Uncharacterized membrane protein [Clostridium grantii DSM 8605]